MEFPDLGVGEATATDTQNVTRNSETLAGWHPVSAASGKQAFPAPVLSTWPSLFPAHCSFIHSP